MCVCDIRHLWWTCLKEYTSQKTNMKLESIPSHSRRSRPGIPLNCSLKLMKSGTACCISASHSISLQFSAIHLSMKTSPFLLREALQLYDDIKLWHVPSAKWKMLNESKSHLPFSNPFQIQCGLLGRLNITPCQAIQSPQVVLQAGDQLPEICLSHSLSEIFIFLLLTDLAGTLHSSNERPAAKCTWMHRTKISLLFPTPTVIMVFYIYICFNVGWNVGQWAVEMQHGWWNGLKADTLRTSPGGTEDSRPWSKSGSRYPNPNWEVNDVAASWYSAGGAIFSSSERKCTNAPQHWWATRPSLCVIALRIGAGVLSKAARIRCKNRST